MRVLQINSVCGIGSTGRIATDIDSLLKEQGHEGFIAYGRGKPINCGNYIKIGNKLSIYNHLFKTRVFDKHGFGSKKATLKFINEVVSIDPDIIHLHNIHGYYINIKLLFDFLKDFSRPIVWTLHDCWPFTGHCSHFNFIGCDRWQKVCHDCPQTKGYPKSLVFDNSNNNYITKMDTFNGIDNLTVVTPSIWLSKLVSKSFLNRYKCVVINNGIDLNVFRPTDNIFKRKKSLEDKFIILGVAHNWGDRKGLRYFIELSKVLEEDEIIVLVGLNNKNLRLSNIVQISRTNNVKKLADIYSSADVFINPTLQDNFPTTNIEALACGTPVITFDTGGSAEILDESSGIVLNHKNTAFIRKAINKIKSRSQSYSTENCVKRAQNNYNKIDRFMDYINLYKSMKE